MTWIVFSALAAFLIAFVAREARHVARAEMPLHRRPTLIVVVLLIVAAAIGVAIVGRSQ